MFTWEDGKLYQGQYENDRKHGYGTFAWNNGRQYAGWWVNGMEHGEGTYRQSDTETGFRRMRGVWEEGKRVKWHDDPE